MNQTLCGQEQILLKIRQNSRIILEYLGFYKRKGNEYEKANGYKTK